MKIKIIFTFPELKQIVYHMRLNKKIQGLYNKFVAKSLIFKIKGRIITIVKIIYYRVN
jgi:hypothetical protein